MGPKVAVVTTSTSWAAFFMPFYSTTSTISSAVSTTTVPFRIFSFISSIVFAIPSPLDVQPSPARLQILRPCLLPLLPHPKCHGSHSGQNEAKPQDYQHNLLEHLSPQGAGLSRLSIPSLEGLISETSPRVPRVVFVVSTCTGGLIRRSRYRSGIC